MAGSLLGTFTGLDGAGNLTTGSRTSTSGSLITAHASCWDSPRSTIAFSDSKSNSYTTTSLDFGATADTMAQGYNANGTRGASHTVTATFAAGVNGSCLVALEWGGIDASPTVVTNSNTGSITTSHSISATAGAASTFIGTFSYSGSATTIAVADGTEAAEIDENASNQPENVAYKVGLTGSQSLGWTLGAGRNCGAIIQAFTEAAGGNRVVNATTQNLALTGQQATLKRQRKVSGTTQGLAFTGQQATVKRNRKASGTTQGLALVGQPATIVRGSNRVIVATTQGLALTGLPATIVRGSAAPAVPVVGGGFPMFRVPAYDKRIEAVEEAIEDVIEAAEQVALPPPPAVNRARLELRRIAEAQKQRELDELEAKRIGAALDALEDDLLDVLERLLKRLARKQKPR